MRNFGIFGGIRACLPTKKAVTYGLKFHQVYVKPLSLSRDSFSLRLGHAPALTVHRTVIHYRRAASLPEWEPTRCCRQHLTASLHLMPPYEESRAPMCPPPQNCRIKVRRLLCGNTVLLYFNLSVSNSAIMQYLPSVLFLLENTIGFPPCIGFGE